MDTDRVPELQPHGRFAMANRDIRQFRRSIIGSKDHCCRDNPASGVNCEEEGYYHQLSGVDFSVQQVDENVVSILLHATKNWGGSGTGFYPHPIVVSAKTGLPFSPPEVWPTLSMVTLKNRLPGIFTADPCAKSLWMSKSDSEKDSFLLAFINGLKTDMQENPQLVVKDDEWHWVVDDHNGFSNACHRLWTIPTGVKFEP